MEDDCAERLPEVIVTDHAIQRYLERAHGMDVAHFRRHLAALAERGVRAGATGVIVDGVKLVLQGHTVVTVLQRGWHSRDLRQKEADKP